jgi:hypothetical protein
MRYSLARFGRIMLERWHAAPVSGDLPAILDAFAIARKEIGGDLVVIEVISAEASLPSAEAIRDAMHCVRRLRYLRSLHLVVIEGDSVKRALIRGVFTPLAFLLGEAVDMCRTVDEAVARACKVTGQDPAALSREIGAAGLLESVPP